MTFEKKAKMNDVIYTSWYRDRTIFFLSCVMLILIIGFIGFLVISSKELTPIIYCMIYFLPPLVMINCSFTRLIFAHENVKLQTGRYIRYARTVPISGLTQVKHFYFPIAGHFIVIYHRDGKKIKRLPHKYGHTEEVFAIIKKNYPHLLPAE